MSKILLLMKIVNKMRILNITGPVTLWENDFSRPNSDPLFCTFSLLACYKGFLGLRFRVLGRVDFSVILRLMTRFFCGFHDENLIL